MHAKNAPRLERVGLEKYFNSIDALYESVVAAYRLGHTH